MVEGGGQWTIGKVGETTQATGRAESDLGERREASEGEKGEGASELKGDCLDLE